MGCQVESYKCGASNRNSHPQVRQERDALEAMRVDFEHELQHAQTEVAKAQDALKTAEDRVRASEQVERQKIISGLSCMRLLV